MQALCEIKSHFDAPQDRQEHLIITIWSSSSSPKKGGYSLLYQEEPAGQTVKPKGGATRWNRWNQVEEAKLTKASRISARPKLDKTLPFCKSVPSLKTPQNLVKISLRLDLDPTSLIN